MLLLLQKVSERISRQMHISTYAHRISECISRRTFDSQFDKGKKEVGKVGKKMLEMSLTGEGGSEDRE